MTAPDGKSVLATIINKDTKGNREMVSLVAHFKGLHKASSRVLGSQMLEVGNRYSQDKQTMVIQNGKKV